MKIKKLNSNYKKLFNLKILKTKIFSRSEKIKNIKTNKIELYLKKVFHIIYKFHTADKKILFIEKDTQKNNELKRLVGKTKHTILPSSVWMAGAINNSLSIIKHLVADNRLIKSKKQKSNTLFNKINKHYDLIVILDNTFNPTTLKEFLGRHAPIITLNSNIDSLRFYTATYKILGNFNLKYKKTRNDFFYTILNSIFKKAQKFKYFKRQQQNRFKRKK